MGWSDLLRGKLPKPRTTRQQTGAAAEDAALAFLCGQGLVLLARNFRCRGGEIDLIMRHGDSVVFVEVRARASGSHGGAAASVTPAKQRRLILAAQTWLQQQPVTPPCRFDVVAVEAGQMQWLRNVIEA